MTVFDACAVFENCDKQIDDDEVDSCRNEERRMIIMNHGTLRRANNKYNKYKYKYAKYKYLNYGWPSFLASYLEIVRTVRFFWWATVQDIIFFQLAIQYLGSKFDSAPSSRIQGHSCLSLSQTSFLSRYK